MERTVHKDKLSTFYEKLRKRGAICDEELLLIRFKISEKEWESWGVELKEGSEDIYEVRWGSSPRYGYGELKGGPTMEHVIDEVLSEL